MRASLDRAKWGSLTIPMTMWRIAAFVLLTPLYTAAAWGIYLGAKWIAALLVASQVDQTAMGVLAVVIASVVIWSLVVSGDD